MSEPTAPHGAEGVTDAPVPWLGGSSPTQTRQTWSSSAQPDLLFALRFPFQRGSYLHCQLRLFLLRYPRTLHGILGSSAFMVAALVAIIYRRHGGFPHRYWLPVVVLVIAFSLFLEVLVLVQYMMPVLVVRKGTQVVFEVRQGSVFGTGMPSLCGLKWSQIARIVEQDGDIYMLPKPLVGLPVAIPSGAFADNDAAKRFYSAVVALWQANGNPSAVPDAIRAEFDPRTAP